MLLRRLQLGRHNRRVDVVGGVWLGGWDLSEQSVTELLGLVIVGAEVELGLRLLGLLLLWLFVVLLLLLRLFLLWLSASKASKYCASIHSIYCV